MSQPTSMWVPPSHSFRAAAQVRKAVSEYDPNLSFGQNPQNGQWCIFLRHGTMEASSEGDFPILGFREIPHPDDALKRLVQTDALRRGREILDEIDRRNAELRRAQDAKHADVDAQVAETFEWGFRKMDSPKNPVRKVFLPGKDNSVYGS